MSTNTVSRVNYFDRQFLRVDEFRDEQVYQLALRRRHNITQHSWGIVKGLELANEEGAAVVQPGIAIDGYGRELLLEAKVTLAPETFEDLATNRLDVWLVYQRTADGSSPNGYGECKSPLDAGYRESEVPKVHFERPLSDKVDARRPPGVSAEVLDAPVPPTSDNPADAWPVYLGRFIRLEDKITLDMSRRPYVGLVAEIIDHPANATRVEIGKRSNVAAKRTVGAVTYSYEKGEDPTGGEGAPPSPSRRFAVFVPEDLTGSSPTSPVTLSPRLEIKADGAIRLRGKTIIDGNLRLAGGAVRFVDAADPTHSSLADPSIYRSDDNGIDQLRIDLGTGNTTNRQFVIGYSTPDGKFTECLRIEMRDITGTDVLVPLVTITGDLKVEGRIVADEIVPRTLTTEAQAAILGAFQAGVAAGNVAS